METLIIMAVDLSRQKWTKSVPKTHPDIVLKLQCVCVKAHVTIQVCVHMHFACVEVRDQPWYHQ